MASDRNDAVNAGLAAALMTFPFSQVLVVGGTGQTGHRLLEALVENSALRLIATSRATKDGLPDGGLAESVLPDAKKWASLNGGKKQLTWMPLDLEGKPELLKAQLDALAAQLEKGAKTALIFAAAFTNVEICESDPEKCRLINEANTSTVLYWASRRFDAQVVFYSTDYVFDGLNGPYSETAAANALSRYGQAKLAIEQWLERNVRDPLIIRTTGVYDFLPGSKNFLMQVLERLGQGRAVQAPSDQFANPVWAKELARATLELLSKRASGVFNVAGGGWMPRTEFATTIAKCFGFDSGLIQGILTSDLNQKAKRPLKGGLDCSKLQQKLGWAPRHPQDVLSELARR